jgi:hypothetical protein
VTAWPVCSPSLSGFWALLSDGPPFEYHWPSIHTLEARALRKPQAYENRENVHYYTNQGIITAVSSLSSYFFYFEVDPDVGEPLLGPLVSPLGPGFRPFLQAPLGAPRSMLGTKSTSSSRRRRRPPVLEVTADAARLNSRLCLATKTATMAAQRTSTAKTVPAAIFPANVSWSR